MIKLQEQRNINKRVLTEESFIICGFMVILSPFMIYFKLLQVTLKENHIRINFDRLQLNWVINVF